jgi:NH3-dependent NAD+ synthetase
MAHTVVELIDSIRTTAASAGTLLVPVSGGSDSALCFFLCAKAFPEKAVAVHAGTSIRAEKWFRSVGPLEFSVPPGDHGEREEMRWGRFLALSLARRAWLVGSRNRTEDELGTYSLASRVATYLPIVGVWKSEVQRLCEEVGVPDEIIASSRRADPDCGRPPELAEIPFESIERYLQAGEGASAASMQLTDGQRAYLASIKDRNSFKRSLPLRGPSYFSRGRS